MFMLYTEIYIHITYIYLYVIHTHTFLYIYTHNTYIHNTLHLHTAFDQRILDEFYIIKPRKASVREAASLFYGL